MMFKAIALFLALSTTASAGNLQNADFATSAQITGAGGSVSQLLNTSKMFNTVDSEIMNTSIARWNAKLSSPVSLATQVSGILPLANGGTNSSAAASAGSVVYSDASKFALTAVGTSGQVLTSAGTGTPTWTTPTTGSVTSVSVVSANGFSGSVATATTTPAITLATTVTGIVKGNGTALSAAVSGTDFQAPISTSAAVSNQFLTAFTAPNTFSRAQPAFSDLSGNATNAQMPTYTNHVVLLGTGAAGLGATAVGATNTLLHGNTGADPTYSAVVNADITNATIDLTTKVTGVLPKANVGLGRTINAQTGTTYTFVLADGASAGGNPLVTSSNASAQTITVPTNASVAFPVGEQIDICQQGAGKMTLAAAGGVTLNSKSSNLSASAQFVCLSLFKTATNTWTVVGDLIAGLFNFLRELAHA